MSVTPEACTLSATDLVIVLVECLNSTDTEYYEYYTEPADQEGQQHAIGDQETQQHAIGDKQIHFLAADLDKERGRGIVDFKT